MVAGLIYSAGRTGSWFREDTKLPVLFMHHEKDGCSNTLTSNTEMLYKKMREAGNLDTDLALIKTGIAFGKNVCESGYHMYFDADTEVIKALDTFMTKYTKPL